MIKDIFLLSEWYEKDSNKYNTIYHITSAKDISGYTRYYKEVIKLELFIFLESLKVLGKSKSFIKKKNKGFFITLRIC